MMSQHLSQTQLAAYSERTLNTDDLLAVDSHLASCDECHERLTRMAPAVATLNAFESDEGPFHLDYEQHLEPYVDGQANDIEREIIDSHVALCAECAADLKDLLEFKQQPVAAATVHVHSSSRWKQWLPQWRLLPNPVLATAVVIIVFGLLAAVVLWTIYPKSRGVEQAATVPPVSDKQPLEKQQPSPAATDHTAQTSPPSNQSQNDTVVPAPPSEKPQLVLNDAGGQVIVNQHGRLEGLHELPPDLRESVERALATRKLGASPGLTGWSTGAGRLRSELNLQTTFAPLAPTDVVLETDRPTFRWQALDAAQDYTVTIYDANLRQVAISGPVTSTEWTTPNPLARGVTYSWQISALREGKRVVTPQPPLPQARFRILDQSAVVTLARLKESVGSSHLAMGVFYWKHGLIVEAEREFQALAKANPDSAVATALLTNIRSIRRR